MRPLAPGRGGGRYHRSLETMLRDAGLQWSNWPPPAAHRAFAKATRRLSKTERIYVVVFARNMSRGPHIRPLRAPRNGWFSSLYVSEPPIVTTIFSSGSSWRTPRTPSVD